MSHLQLPPSSVSHDATLERLRNAMRVAWKPRTRQAVSQIAEKVLHLSPEYSKVEGPVDLDLYPYLREPMDCLSPTDPTRVVVFQGPIQGGKTIIGQAWLSAIITEFPGPTLWVTDTETKAELFSKKRFDLMVRDSPALRALVADPKSRSKDSTIRRKVFPAGDVEFVGAQSSSGVTSNTFKNVIIDEADDHRSNLSGAGSSIALAMGRQTSFGDLAKTLIVSSPKTKGDSEIETWHDRGDCREFRVPCPACGEYQTMRFRERDATTGAWRYNLVWPKGHPEEARYFCRHCGIGWMNNDKNKFLRLGRWVATRPDQVSSCIASFSLNCLYLPVGLYSWVDLARQWDSAIERMKAGDFDELRSVINTRLAETFEQPGDTMDAHELQRLVEPDWGELIPAGVRVITIGTDVQRHTRLETMVVGWGAGLEAWILDYHVTLMDPEGREAWDRHDEIVRQLYRTQDGRTLRPVVTCVDRGDLAQHVLEYTGARYKWGVYAIKGDDGTPQDAIWDRKIRRSDRGKKRGSTYFSIRVVPAKDYLQGALRVTRPGPKYIHIPDRILRDFPDFLDQMTAERRVKTRDSKGRVQVAWLKIAEHRRNEVWDTLVYALGGVHSLMMGGMKLDAPVRLPAPTSVQRVDPPQSARHARADVSTGLREEAPLDDYWAERGG